MGGGFCRGRGRGRGRGNLVVREMKKGNRSTDPEELADWGSYMEAKRLKLLDQFHNSEIKKVSNIFEGIAILVNGLTRPSADELKNIMATHGGEFHMYQSSTTTHIIASNLPNVKIKNLGTIPIVKPSWIVDSVAMNKLLDFKKYLLYNNQSRTQPRLDFTIVQKNENFTIPPKSSVDGTSKANDSTKIGISNLERNVGDHDLTKVENTSVVDTKSKAITKTAADPNFLQEFYQNSRLHLISTLCAEYKNLVNKLRETSDGHFPGKDKLIAKKAEGPRVFYPAAASVVMHIDMDCFFVSVALRSRPDLRGQPLAITHARNARLTNENSNRGAEFRLWEQLEPGEKVDIGDRDSMSEIASCSYEARKCGVRNGMFLGQAIKLCPELKTQPYDFEGYKEVSNILYTTIATYTLDIEAMSCDEMYVDVTKVLKETGLSVEEWATHIRNEIMEATGCPCSTGFGANRLQARLATRKAKPAGQYYLQADDVEAYMAEIPLSDLPGVGRVTLSKLSNLGLNTCGDVQMKPLNFIQSVLGKKVGQTLKDQARGIDNRPLNFTHERKSISADVNYGIRFKKLEECYAFLQSLAEEVFNRMTAVNMTARGLTLKLLVRAAEAPVETAKYLGCGVCESITKSSTANIIFNDPNVIYKEVKALYDKIDPPFVDLRGVGIQMTKLEKSLPVNSVLSNFLKQSSKKENSAMSIDRDKSKNEGLESKENIAFDDRPIVKEGGARKKTVENSRRGRPKGSKSGSTRNKEKHTSNIIGDYFGKSKVGSQQGKGKQQPQPSLSPHEIDLKVLNELPEDLRNEIIKEYQLERKLNQVPKVGDVQLQSSQETKASTRKSKSPFTNMSWEQIKPVLNKWIATEKEPADVDTEMIANHFRQMALDRKIEQLHKIFRYLHRIFSGLTCPWHAAYMSMVNIMQQGMVAKYGNTLMVQTNFECCHM
ncbi:unnamed protein product [Callosobruchus maculatus]|uniref:DNA repair protein REV1 n=1 Tax=Callosobruchus maculatus TaxID=64391 RepID=A0A653DGQ3_CALMS|nr:unnamed protein product [Callosobruchus maculatus]